MNFLNIGIIGLGRFGEVETAVLTTFPNVIIKALSSKSIKRIKEIASRYNIRGAEFNTEYKDLIDNNEIDAVIIASEAKDHKEQALYAISKGKNVFIEKPIALTYEDSLNIADAAKEAEVLLMVGYLYRYEINRSVLKKFIQSDRVGKILYLTFRNSCSRSWFQTGSHYFHPVHETMIHDIDLALWYTQSKVKKVYAKQIFAFSNKFPDACIATLTFENGIIATFDTNWVIPNGAPITLEKYNGTLDSSFELVGTKMVSRMRLTDSGFVIWSDEGVIIPETVLYPELNGNFQGALKSELEDFILCVLNNTRSSIASSDDAIYGMKIADNIVKSASSESEIVL